MTRNPEGHPAVQGETDRDSTDLLDKEEAMTVFGHPPPARGRSATAGACAAVGAIGLSLLAAGCGSQQVTAGTAASSGPGSSVSASATGPSGPTAASGSSASPGSSAPAPASAPAPVGGSAPGGGSTVNPGGPMLGFPVASPEAQVGQLPAGATYITFSGVSRSADGMTLYLTFEAAGGSCGLYDAVAQQTSSKVSVGIAHLPKASGVMCPMYITAKDLEVQLSAPLGSRSVVDLANGQTASVALAGGVPGAVVPPRIPGGSGTERGDQPF
jgi:hypothetical protein